MKLTDSTVDQYRLEELLDQTKPNIPEDGRQFHYLIMTPFRYQPERNGSRFRRYGDTPGVFYCADSHETAIAENLFYLWKFFIDSPDTAKPLNFIERTGFSVDIDAEPSIDLTAGPFSANKNKWEDRNDYAACQELAAVAREAGISAIKYKSVRTLSGDGDNLAVLAFDAFKSTSPTNQVTWKVWLDERGAKAACNYPKKTIEISSEELDSLR